jgi:glycosidase
MRPRTVSLVSFVAFAAAVSAACDEEPLRNRRNTPGPPDGVAGFDPGDTPPGDGTGAYGQGASGPGTGGSGTGGSGTASGPGTGTAVCEGDVQAKFDWRDSVIYFVFVDRFFDGNPANNAPLGAPVLTPADYQGGDFAGVRQKLDEGYFDELGINTLWLTMPTDNADIAGQGLGGDPYQYSAYHGYWPKDLDQVESHFGDEAELKGLIDAAHAKGIKVILDYVMNHVHDTSQVYVDHPDWFWPRQDGSRDCLCGAGCGWDGADGRRCWFTPYLPDFDFTRPEARGFSIDNAVDWINRLDLDGFRLDAVKHIEDQWLIDLRSRVRAEIEPGRGEHFYMVGETFTGDRDLINHYVDPCGKLDGQFDFPWRMEVTAKLLMRKGSMNDLEGFLAFNENWYGAGRAVMSTFLGNHDIPRVVHFAQNVPLWGSEWDGGKDRNWSNQPGSPADAETYQRLATGFTLLLTTKGAPLIYYGDEYGMPGAGDPDNRRFMQWSGYNAGQSALNAHIKKLTALRAQHPAMRRGVR